MRSVLIPDGYTLTGKIEELPGVWPEVRVKYRWASPERRAEHRWAVASARSGEEVFAADLALLTEHVQRWDAVDEAGAAVPFKPEVLRKVHDGILQKLLSLVTGYTAPLQDADIKN